MNLFKIQKHRIASALIFIVSLAIASLAAADSETLIFKANLERTGAYSTQGPDADPRLVWRFHVGSPISTTPIVYDDIVYIISFEGILYALDKANATVIWKKDLHRTSAIYNLSGNEEVVFASSGSMQDDKYDEHLLAIDRFTGNEIWRFTPSSPTTINSSTTYKNFVFITSSGQTESIYAINIKTGRKIWKRLFSGRVKLPVIQADTQAMYIQDESQTVYSLDINTGEVIWEHIPTILKDRLSRISTTPTIDNYCVYVLFIDGRAGVIAKLDKNNGKHIGMIALDSIGYSSISLADDVVFIGDDGQHDNKGDGYMNAINKKNGELNWRFKTDGFVRSSASIAENTVFFGSHDTFMYAVDRITGNLKWRYKTGGGVFSTPNVSNGRLYFGSNDGYLYVLE